MLTRSIYALYRIFFKTIGLTSEGVRLCFQHGLTSGKTLDYIYKNQPTGSFGIGKFLDKLFLNDPAWEAVRIRRRNLESLILSSVESLKTNNQTISLLDIASGPGAYILSVAKTIDDPNFTARCRDFDARWVEEGNAAAKLQNLSSVVFEQGDAFDREDIGALTPAPNIAVSSGFYDWFTDDCQVKESMQIIYDALLPGGFFVLSIQANHPKLALTEAIFVDFNHKPLKMTMRSQELVQSWLESIGFLVQETLSDQNNYYTVLKATKPLEV